MPTDPRFMELSQNEEMLHFVAYWLAKKETDTLDRWAKMLGIHWTREQVEAISSGDKKKSATAPDRLMIPLAMAINPDLLEGLKKTFRVAGSGGKQEIGGGEYVPKAGEEIVEMGEMPREEWLKWINGATPVVADAARQLNELAQPVSIHEGASNDPRIEKIRQQIAQSKRW